jgi:membrane protein implicated in regulation of membrane protease activity
VPPWIWLLAGVVLIGAEVLSGDFVLLMLGVGALAAGGVAALSGLVVLQLIGFVLVAGGLVTLARPPLRHRLQGSTKILTNTEALLGSRATVVATVDKSDGRVRIGGEIWSARSMDDKVLEPGTDVTVVEISGATAVVLEQG